MEQIYLKYWDKCSQGQRRLLFFNWNKLIPNCKEDELFLSDRHYFTALIARLYLSFFSPSSQINTIIIFPEGDFYGIQS